MKNETLELNLIKALGKLQHTIIDQEFLDGDTPVVAEILPEPFFAFHIGQHHFVVNANCFCEVFVDTHIAALPNSPGLLRGLCNLRGVLMPVYQLHQILDVPAPKKAIIFCVGNASTNKPTACSPFLCLRAWRKFQQSRSELRFCGHYH